MTDDEFIAHMAELDSTDGSIFVRLTLAEKTRLLQLAKRGSAEAGTWQPMETAPKDGRVILLYGCEFRRHIIGRGYWFQGVPGDGEGWITSSFYTQPSDDMRGLFTPTMWMPMLPLPAVPPPAADKEKS